MDEANPAAGLGERLLAIARAHAEAAVRGESPPPLPAPADPREESPGAAFVTIRNAGILRGCIGTLSAVRPLAQAVAGAARSAATEDSRFSGDPIAPGELPALSYEVSVLSPLRRVPAGEPPKPGEGVWVRRFGRSGCLLPQVATEQGWSPERLVREACALKAGLPEDAWRDPATEVWAFTVEKFAG